MKKLVALIIMIVIIVIVNFVFFTVKETEQAIVMQLGEPVRTISQAGLKYRIPFLQSVKYFDKRESEYDIKLKEVYTIDGQNLKVDSFVRWKIKDPLLFYKSAGGIKTDVQAQLDDIICSEASAELGKYKLEEIISSSRAKIMDGITKNSNEDSKRLGIEIVDVRIKRVELLNNNINSVYARMNIECEQEANRYRIEGEQEAEKIRFESEKEKEIILSEAMKETRRIRDGVSDEVLETYIEVCNHDKEYYNFIKEVDKYRGNLKDENTLIVDSKNKFLKYFDNNAVVETQGENNEVDKLN